MKGSDLKRFRKATKMSLEALAKKVDLDSSTIQLWEEEDRELCGLYKKAFRDIFGIIILQPLVQNVAIAGFNKIECEMAAVWLVREDECILLPKTPVYKCFYPKNCPWFNPKSKDKNLECLKKYCFRGEITQKDLQQKSMTTSLLYDKKWKGKILNLRGDDITFHPLKRFPTRLSPYLYGGKDNAGGLVHTLLHIPLIEKNKSILLLSFENKLDKDGNVLKYEGQDGKNGFSKDDEKNALQLLKSKVVSELIREMKIFSYV